MMAFDLIDDALDVLRRRWRLILAVTILGSVASILFALSTPRLYQATEVIQVEHSTVSDDLVPSQARTASARRIQSIEQRLMTRDTILEMVAQLDLFADRPAMTDTEKVTAIRQSVSIEGRQAARDGYTDDGTLSILSITAYMNDPSDAQRLAHEFAQRTLHLSAQQRFEAAQQTVEFFRLQETSLRAEISTVEDALQAFRNDNALSISGTLDFLRTQIGGINESLRDIDREIALHESEIERLSGSSGLSTVEQRRIDTLRGELDDLTRQRNRLIDSRNALEADISGAPGIERELAAFERQLSGLQDQLSIVSSRLREAETNLALERADQGGRLTVIEAATVPEYAVSRSRKVTALMGGLASLAAALGLALLFEWLNPVIRTPAQMQRRFGLRPVMAVPSLDGGHLDKRPDRVAETGTTRRGLLRRRAV